MKPDSSFELTFFLQCEAFLNGRALASAKRALYKAMRDLKERYVLSLNYSDTTSFISRVVDRNLYVLEISVSKVFLHKLFIYRKLWEYSDPNYYGGPRTVAFSYDHPLDLYTWRYSDDDTFPFDFRPQLRDFLSVNFGYRTVADLSKFFSLYRNDSFPGILPLYLSNDLTEAVQIDVEMGLVFIVLHEFAHVVGKHGNFLKSWTYKDISRSGALAGRIHRYKHKAIECHADIGATMLTIWHHDYDVTSALRAISLVIGMFDFDRRTTFDKKTVDGLYPLPEIRFEIIMMSIAPYIGTSSALELRRSIMEYALVVHQQAGLLGGPFYLHSGQITSTDTQFMKEIQILGLIEQEIEKIIIQLNQMPSYKNGKVFPKNYDLICPLGMTRDEFLLRFRRETIRFFTEENYVDNVSSDEAQTERMAEIRQRLRPGDQFILSCEDSKELSIFMEGLVKSRSV